MPGDGKRKRKYFYGPDEGDVRGQIERARNGGSVKDDPHLLEPFESINDQDEPSPHEPLPSETDEAAVFEAEKPNPDAEPVSESLAQFQIDHIITPKVRFCFVAELIEDKYPQTADEIATLLGISKGEAKEIAEDLISHGHINMDDENGKLTPTAQSKRRIEAMKDVAIA